MTRLFVLVPQGRLGNLIFQHQAVASISGGGTVLALDSEYFDLFEKPPRFLVIPCSRSLRSQAQIVWAVLFQRLARYHCVGTIQPGSTRVLDDHVWEAAEADCKTGFFKSIYVVKGFFQTSRYAEPLPRVKLNLRLEAERRLGAISKEDRVAVHMRFGDYLHWSVFGEPGSACLPVSYYAQALALIKGRLPTAHFCVFSDEPQKAEAMLRSAAAGDRFTIVDDGTASGDFALMTCCSHAVISASSFAWWAAMLIGGTNPILVAPKYWLGFRRKTWLPPEIQSRRFVYIDPLDDP